MDEVLLRLKQAVYEANMLLWEQKLVIHTWGNVSGIDRERGIFAIKPSGVRYEALKASDIVLISMETGQTVEENALRPSSDTPTHLVLYRMFPAIGGVTHTHSTYATAWAQAGRDIPCYGTTHADAFYGSVPCTRFVSQEETQRDYEAETGYVIAEAFAGLDPMHTPGALVRGHGPFTWGRDAAESVYNASVLEETARMALLTEMLTSQSVGKLPDWISEKHFTRKHGANAYYGQEH